MTAHETTPSDAAIAQAVAEVFQLRKREGRMSIDIDQAYERAREIEQSRGALPDYNVNEGERDNRRQPQGTTSGGSPDYSRSPSPELPEPCFELSLFLDGKCIAEGFTAEQMTAYGEACRRMGDDYCQTWLYERLREYGDSISDGLVDEIVSKMKCARWEPIDRVPTECWVMALSISGKAYPLWVLASDNDLAERFSHWCRIEVPEPPHGERR